jgi:excisionase family DNA binding protein
MPPFQDADVQTADPLWTTREAAQRLGVSLRTVQLWVEAGILPAGRTAGGHRRIRRSDVEALVQRSGLREPARREPTRQRVLLVEDQADLLHLWQTTLEGLGDRITVQTASNGYAALLELGRQRPQVLVTDLMMPGMDGFEMLRSLSRSGDLDGTHVVVITALGQSDIAARGGLPEPVTVLHKPVSPDQLLSHIESLLPSRHPSA